VFYCCQFLYETISVNTAGNHEKENWHPQKTSIINNV
jgi:hypothetical protein